MPSDYIVRPYQPGNEEGIVELLETVFDGWPHFDLDCTPLDHWRWKIRDNPLEQARAIVAISDNKIIGCTHILPFRIQIGDNLYFACQGVDAAVHPSFRERGIFNKMLGLNSEIEKEIGIVFRLRFSSNPILINRNIRRGFPRFPHDIIHFIRIHDIDLHFKMYQSKYSWLKKYVFYLIKFFNKLNSALSVSHKSEQTFRIYEIANFDDRINVFWDEVKNYYNFIVEKSKDYLNWRYCDLRGGNYIIRIAEVEGIILGYSVLRINRYREEYPVGYIVDLLTLPHRLDVADALVKDAIEYFDSNNINYNEYLSIKDHLYKKIFQRQGFVKRRLKMVTFFELYEKIGRDYEKLQTSSPSSVHLVYGDIDWI
jgi:GNAT superfamily N-acetyltransferase